MKNLFQICPKKVILNLCVARAHHFKCDMNSHRANYILSVIWIRIALITSLIHQKLAGLHSKLDEIIQQNQTIRSVPKTPISKLAQRKNEAQWNNNSILIQIFGLEGDPFYTQFYSLQIGLSTVWTIIILVLFAKKRRQNYCSTTYYVVWIGGPKCQILDYHYWDPNMMK